MTTKGSCLCGRITFEIETIVGPAEYCHCTRCRKVSGGSALLMIGVSTKGFRFLSGKEHIKLFSAPILYQGPAYHNAFCSECGCSAPNPDPQGEWFEIPMGLLDDDPGLKPDKHIYVDFLPSWDNIADQLPQYTLKDIYKLRIGKELPDSFIKRPHNTEK